MNHHSIICRLGVRDQAKIPLIRGDSHVTEISFIEGERRLSFGLGQALDQLSAWGLTPSERSTDLALLATVLTAADTRISRKTESQDAWTREIDLYIPVDDPRLWEELTPLLVKMLNFLTGDRWGFQFRARIGSIKRLAVSSENLRMIDPTCVCLFSGGLDSFIGAIDLLTEGHVPIFVSHYWDSITSSRQSDCIRALSGHFQDISIHQIRARVGFPNDIVEDSAPENTLRGRSFLFFALAALTADAVGGDVVVEVPENGLISLNVPLDPVRLGALSTRTTHPYYMARFDELLRRLDLSIRLENRYRHKTKGAMVKECSDIDFLRTNSKITMSCSSPAKARWSPVESQREPKHCGHCVPCLIRRASLVAGFGEDDTPYQIPDLRRKVLDSTKAEGNHVRSFLIALSRLSKNPALARFDIHRPGPLADYPADLAAYETVYTQGLLEVGQLLNGVRAKPK